MLSIQVLALTTFIANNPGLTAWIFGGLISTIVGLLVGYYGFIGHRISKLEVADEHMANELTTVKEEMSGYKEHIGAGDRELKKMADALNIHMTREEVEVWGSIKEITRQMAAIQVENVNAHAAIVERIAKMEAGLPNGSMRRLIELMEDHMEQVKTDERRRRR